MVEGGSQVAEMYGERIVKEVIVVVEEGDMVNGECREQVLLAIEMAKDQVSIVNEVFTVVHFASTSMYI